MAIARVRAVVGGVSGLPGLSTFYFHIAGTSVTAAEANDVTGRVRLCWDAFKALLAAGTTVLVQQGVDVLDSASGALLAKGSATAAPAVVTSTGVGELPPATAMGLRLFTAVVIGGRALQGRAFLSPLSTNAATAGVPSSTAITAANAAGAALLTGATGSTCVVWHRPSIAHTGGLAADVSSVGADSAKLWVLRSRRD